MILSGPHRRSLFCFLVTLSVLAIAGAGVAQEASGARHILVYPCSGDAALAPACTQALKANLKQGQTATVTEFRADLPTLRRAVLEGALRKDDITSVEPEARRRVCAALQAEFYTLAEVFQQDGAVALKFQAFHVPSGREFDFSSEAKPPSESTGSVRESLVLSVANTVASQFITEVLGKVPPAAPAVIPISIKPTPPADARPVTSSPEGGANTPSSNEPPAEPATGPPAPVPPAPAPFDSAGALQSADSMAAAGDVAGAIQVLRDAVNKAPGDVALRMKLADLYKRKGMEAEAAAELQRAMQLGPTDAGSREAMAKQLAAAGDVEKAKKLFQDILKDEPRNSAARVAYGDLLWNTGNTDGAAAEYAQAANDTPSDATPYEKLARLFASRGQFLTASTNLEAARQIRRQSPELPVDSGLYRSLIQSVDVAYFRHRDSLDDAGKDYTAGRMTREDYYQKTRKLITDLEELTEFLAEIVPPADYATPHLHRTLGASLLSQSVVALQDWLVTGKDSRKSEWEGYRRESESEMDTALTLDRRIRAG